MIQADYNETSREGDAENATCRGMKQNINLGK
jgi:hypothetical protein